MTTIERRRPHGGATDGRDGRLYLLAFLAAGYVMAWWRFGAPAPRGAATLPVPALAPASAPPRTAAWFHELPPAARPPVTIPAGWRLAERPALSSPERRRAVPAPGRPSPPRRGRIRTRSS